MRRTPTMNTSRRRLLQASLAVAAPALIGLGRRSAAEPPPETGSILLEDFPSACLAPQLLAETLLRAEGFQEVRYVRNEANVLQEGPYDLAMVTVPALLASLEHSDTFVAIAGIHAGCQELFASAAVPTVRDMRGKSVAISAYKSGEHIFVSSVAAYVGVDPQRDIHWRVAGSSRAALDDFVAGRSDVYLTFAPQPEVLRTRRIGHVILNTTEDRPWSQYFCCVLAVRREYARHYPVATKRALRALLKATDICASDPERAARAVTDKQPAMRPEVALDVLRSLPFNRWREANPEDSLRFHALRLAESGMISANPNELVRRGSDWRFLREVRRELGA